MDNEAWVTLKEKSILEGRPCNYLTFFELVPLVRAAIVAGDVEVIDADLNEGDPAKELAYVGTALVAVQFARWGWNPPPAMIWTVN